MTHTVPMPTMTPDEIKSYRSRLGLSQSELARRLPVSVDALQNWEIGRRRPPEYLPRALADLEREMSKTAAE